MSFKGITWAGNVYEKFEAMCLEVEEAMYQDTVKYMENQVQKVGVSVKKFYSEVMEDLSPLSCVDPTSLASDDLSLNPHGHSDFNKKPKPSLLDDCRGLNKKENHEQMIPDVTADKGSSLSGYDLNLFSPQSPGIFIENKSSEKCAASKKIGVHRRPIGIKRISRNNLSSNDSCRNTSVSEDVRNKVANCNMRTSSRVAFDNADVTSSSDFDGRCEPVNGNAPILDNPIKSPASNKSVSSESGTKDTSRVACDDTNVTSSSDIGMREPGEAVKGNTPSRDNNLIECPASKKALSAEPMRQIKDVSDSISPASDNNLSDESVRLKAESASSCSGSPTESSGAWVNDISFPVLGSRIRSNVCNLEFEGKGVTMSNEDTSMKDDSSSDGSIPYNTESCNQDIIMSNKDSFEVEFVENVMVAEPSLENVEASGSVKLEESCILVDGDELHCALQGIRKHKSYKKRIREALSSRLKSRKDDPFVSQHTGGEKEEMSVRVRDRAVDSEEQKVSVHDAVESDWELL